MMNSFNYRKIFNKTSLIDLYKHDLKNPLGSKLVIDNIIFTKVLTNDLFSKKEFFKNTPRNNLNSGDSLRIMNKLATKSWHGFSPFWNSVYEIKR